VLARAGLVREALEASNAAPAAALSEEVDSLEVVEAQIESFIRQRRSPALRASLGDADALALACYEPVAEFARAHGLALTSNLPVTELGYDLSIWTAFIPTGLAPIWLPQDFFSRIAWWPALAHEIAHDFYASTAGLDRGLREQLGLVSHAAGTRPLAFGPDGLSVHELYRVFGGWFEELFCDVFGTLMFGPAYGWTAVEHFARPDSPLDIARVQVDESGRRYDEHPPRHLRIVAIAQVLEDIGQYDDAELLRDQWAALHDGDPEAIVFPLGGELVGLPSEPFVTIAAELAHRLYSEPLGALAGYRLPDIPGVDFGPHANQEALRARGELLGGRVPDQADARSVVAGAVLAWREQPTRETQVLELARRAIAATGTFEHAEDAYVTDAYARPHPDAYARPHLDAYAQDEADDGGAVAWAPMSSREAFVLHTLLSPPPAAWRPMTPVAARARGFLARRGR
jgi:hypothetical protein